LSWGPDAPDMWAAISVNEREERGEVGTDQAIIDGDHFFVRGRIEINVSDTDDLFAWLVWVEVSKDDFRSIGELWTIKGREKTDPYKGHLANSLPGYLNSTLGVIVKVHTRPVGVRPFIEIIEDHALRSEQRDGISAHRVQGIADAN
jgi:hypothetical protein